MERQSQLLLALAAVLLGLVAVIALVEPPDGAGSEDGEAGTEWSRLLPDIDAVDVTALRLRRGDDLRAFSRDPDGWRVVAPVQADADDIRVEAMVDSLVTVQVGPDLGGDPESYGLDSPHTTVTVETAAGDEHRILLGIDAPVGTHTYLRLGPDGPPRASRTRLSPALEVPLADLREGALWQLPTSAVSSLDLRAPDWSLSFSQESGSWWVTGGDGPARRADDAAVEALLQELSAIRAAGFRDDLAPGDLVPDWRISVRAAGSVQILEVQGAAGAVDGDASAPTTPAVALARAPLQPGVVTLEEAWADRVSVPVTAWWARGLLPLSREALARVTLRLGDAEATAVAEDEGGFTVAGGRSVLEALEATGIRPGDTPVPTGPAWGEVHLELRDGGHRVLRLHQQLPDGARVGIDTAGGAAFAVPAAEVARLSSALAAEQ